MKFGRIGPAGTERPVVILDDTAYDIRSITADIDGDFLSSGRLVDVQQSLATGSLPVVAEHSELRIGAPIARPSAVICVGMNYAEHAAESGSTPPENVIIFLKPPNTVVGACDLAFIPRGSTKTDWEVELGVVIGKRASYLASQKDSIDHVGGFVLADDLSERTFQLELSGGQWSKGKSAAGFTPLGPWLVTADELDYSNLRLRSWVNGDARQNSTTADMIFDVDYLVWHLSQFMVLEPGDLILTGTPQGVALSGRFPFLAAGDIVELEIDGLGRARHEFAQA